MSKKKQVEKKEDGTVEVGHITENRKARYQYDIIETFEAGIKLTGNEIKSIRAGHITINEAYVKTIKDELFLMQAHISEYSHSSAREYDPVRPRKLLLHRREINKLMGRVAEKGLTIAPLKLYITKKGLAKLLIGLAKGKNAPDKKKATIDREKKREAERAMKGRFD